MSKLAKDELYLGGVVPIEKVVRSIERVRVQDVRDAAERYLVPERTTLTAIGKGLAKELPDIYRPLVH